MKMMSINSVLVLTCLFAGCGKQPGSASAKPLGTAAVAEPAMTAWGQGDSSTAVNKFVEADWSRRPLFSSSSPLSLTEAQFKALSDSERQSKSAEINAQLEGFKKLAAAVAQAGREMGGKGDREQARKYFMALKQCGTALESPDCLAITQLFGRAFKRMADTELAKVPQ